MEHHRIRTIPGIRRRERMFRITEILSVIAMVIDTIAVAIIIGTLITGIIVALRKGDV